MVYDYDIFVFFDRWILGATCASWARQARRSKVIPLVILSVWSNSIDPSAGPIRFDPIRVIPLGEPVYLVQSDWSKCRSHLFWFYKSDSVGWSRLFDPIQLIQVPIPSVWFYKSDSVGWSRLFDPIQLIQVPIPSVLIL
jgi:hypothetical protein